MVNLQERLLELEKHEANLVMQLEEVRYLIQGYESTIKAQEEPPATQESSKE